MLAAGGLSTFANVAEAASQPSSLWPQSYFDRYLWRTRVTEDLCGNARTFPRERKICSTPVSPGANPEWFVVDAVGNFYDVTGYGGAYGAGTLSEITPSTGLRGFELR